TDLPFGVAGYTENSWIQSPCFDFSRMKRPLVQLDLMKSFVPNLSGAVLQYQDVIEEGWKTVGLYQGGIEWYNSNSIFNRPGGSSFGWGLNVFVPDTQWKTSRHELDVVAGKTGIKFRIVIGTNGGQGIGNQGLAVDNFRIAERTRRSVLEHFTNSMDFMAISADAMVDQYYLQNNSDVLDLQYHMYYPGLDPMNLNNPDPPSTRAGTMGVGQVPYALLNGGVSYGHRYDFTSPFSSPGPDELKLVSLEIPDFSIDLGVNWLENSMQAEVTVTCEADHYTGNIQLYAAVVESAVTAYTGAGGDQLFRNVVLDMLPTQTGKLLGNGWYQGKTGSVDLAWTYRSFVENVEDLGVIVFIQDRDTREILQAAADFMTPQVGRQPRVSNPVSLEMFPNPAGEVLFIRLGGDLTGGSLLILTDLSGKVVMEEQVNPGYSLHQLDVSHLECGFYLVNRVQNGRLKGRGKLVIGR
ncbi:MAG: T9SS C-terminal target domain-containing protein, partial [Bacteroidetes bacterium]